jgi:hypothetical protein
MKHVQLGVNLLGIFASLGMIIAMLFPWWSFRLAYTEQTDLFPYLISGPGSELVGYHRSPQMALLTVVLIACILLCLFGSLLYGKGGRILLGVSGVLVLLASWRLLVRVAGVAARFDLPIQGHGWGNYGGFASVEVWTWLRPGLYLIVAGGLIAILACILHPKIRLEVV